MQVWTSRPDGCSKSPRPMPQYTERLATTRLQERLQLIRSIPGNHGRKEQLPLPEEQAHRCQVRRTSHCVVGRVKPSPLCKEQDRKEKCFGELQPQLDVKFLRTEHPIMPVDRAWAWMDKANSLHGLRARCMFGDSTGVSKVMVDSDHQEDSTSPPHGCPRETNR